MFSLVEEHSKALLNRSLDITWQVMIHCNMSGRKKEFEDNVVIFKREPGQSKEDVWLIFETKVTGAANNLHSDHAPLI